VIGNRYSVLILLVAVASLATAAVPTARRPDRWEGLNVAQRSQLESLLSRFKNTPRAEQEKRRALLEDAHKVGAKSAAREFLALLDAEDKPVWKSYADAFEMVAGILRQRRPIPAEERRRASAELSEALRPAGGEKLDKAWEAMQTLKRLCCLSGSEVLAASTDLQKLRETLLAGQGLRDHCVELAAPETPAPGPRERLEAMEASIAARVFVRGKDLAVMKANEPLLAELDPQEARQLVDLNVMRVLMGKGALAVDLKLCAAARGHSADMREKGFFSHESPVEGKRVFTDRARLAGTTAGAENIFAGSESFEGANGGWFHSAGHFANMFNAGSRRTGVGRSGGHWTQMFG
jgi:uncharacterized protein YkwD